MGTETTFTVAGGTAPYSFRMPAGEGSIVADTGVYTAPASPGMDIVEGADSLGRTSVAVVTVEHDTTSPRYVAVGVGGLVVYSVDDLATWIRGDSGTGSFLEKVIEDGGRFVAVGEDGIVSVSTDNGAGWTDVGSESVLVDLNGIVRAP